MKVDQDYPLTGWLTCTDALKAYGFTDDEILSALEQEGMTIEDLTDRNFYEREPYTATDKCKTPCLFIRKGSGMVTRYLQHGRLQYEARETVMGFHYREPSRYQGLRHGKIISRLLSNRFLWFADFKWNCYEMHKAEDYEIYMRTSKGSLYVPILAIVNRDPNTIIDRMVTHYQWYRRSSSYDLNKRKGETPEQFSARKEQEYHKDLEPMRTEEARKLFAALRS